MKTNLNDNPLEFQAMSAIKIELRTLSVPALLAAILLTPTAGIGQAAPAHEAPESEVARALQLEAESLAGTDRSSWNEAAALFVEAAEVSGFGSIEAVENLRKASFMRYYLGDKRQALELMEEAANQAVATGQVLLAAHSYIDGAWLAMEMDRTRSAREFGERARLLAASPHLSEMDRVSILGRVGVSSIALLSGL
jgi:hypothetical protein